MPFGSRRLWTFSLLKLQSLWPLATLLDLAFVHCNTFQPSSNNGSHTVLASQTWTLQSSSCEKRTAQHNGITNSTIHAQFWLRSTPLQCSHTKTSVVWFILPTQLQYQNVLLSHSRIWPPECVCSPLSSVPLFPPLPCKFANLIRLNLIALVIIERNKS